MKVRVNNVGAYDGRVLLRQGVLRPLLGEHFRAAAEEEKKKEEEREDGEE